MINNQFSTSSKVNSKQHQPSKTAQSLKDFKRLNILNTTMPKQYSQQQQQQPQETHYRCHSIQKQQQRSPKYSLTLNHLHQTNNSLQKSPVKVSSTAMATAEKNLDLKVWKISRFNCDNISLSIPSPVSSSTTTTTALHLNGEPQIDDDDYFPLSSAAAADIVGITLQKYVEDDVYAVDNDKLRNLNEKINLEEDDDGSCDSDIVTDEDDDVIDEITKQSVAIDLMNTKNATNSLRKQQMITNRLWYH